MTKSAEILARNLRRLMDFNDHTQTDVATKAGVSQKTISDILFMRSKNGTSIGHLEAIANIYKLPAFQLLMADLPDELLRNKQIAHLCSNFAHSDDAGRKATMTISETCAHYQAEHKNLNANKCS